MNSRKPMTWGDESAKREAFARLFDALVLADSLISFEGDEYTNYISDVLDEALAILGDWE